MATNKKNELSFEDKFKIIANNVKATTKATATAPAKLVLKPGVTKNTLLVATGYKPEQKQSFDNFYNQAKFLLRNQSMVVIYDGQKMTGEEMRQKVGKTSRAAFESFIKANEENRNQGKETDFDIICPGMELPNFGRATQVIDATSVFSSLFEDEESEQPESEQPESEQPESEQPAAE